MLAPEGAQASVQFNVAVVIQVTGNSDNPGLFPEGSIEYSASPAPRLTLTPVGSQFGQTRIEVVVAEGVALNVYRGNVQLVCNIAAPIMSLSLYHGKVHLVCNIAAPCRLSFAPLGEMLNITNKGEST